MSTLVGMTRHNIYIIKMLGITDCKVKIYFYYFYISFVRLQGNNWFQIGCFSPRNITLLDSISLSDTFTVVPF